MRMTFLLSTGISHRDSSDLPSPSADSGVPTPSLGVSMVSIEPRPATPVVELITPRITTWRTTLKR